MDAESQSLDDVIQQTTTPAMDAESQSLDDVIQQTTTPAMEAEGLSLDDVIQQTTTPDTDEVDATALSLDEVIKRKKIHARRSKSNYEDATGTGDMDVMAMSLDDVIKQKRTRAERSKDIDKSLDEIIGRRNGGRLQGQNGGRGNGDRKRKREQDEGREEAGYVMSPLDVVEFLTTRKGYVIEHDSAKKKVNTDGRSHTWRSQIRSGDYTVTVESSLKELAKQAAASELLMTIRKADPTKTFPKFAIPEGCFYDPVIVDRVKEQCVNSNGIEPRYATQQERFLNRDFFKTVCTVGEDEFYGNSFNENHSKIFAARAAYKTYACKPFPKERYHVIDEEQLPASEVRNYESLATHAISVDKCFQMELGYGFGGVEGLLGLDAAESTEDEREEILVDDDGQMYVRTADGTNKIKRLRKLNDVASASDMSDADEGSVSSPPPVFRRPLTPAPTQ